MLIGLAGATLLFSAAHAGADYAVQKNPYRLTSGGHIFGPVIFDRYRSLDGKDFYQDDSLPRSNGVGAFNIGSGILARIHFRSPLLRNSSISQGAAAALPVAA
jgi:hypothetical protein